jgi:hypothetical protein
MGSSDSTSLLFRDAINNFGEKLSESKPSLQREEIRLGSAFMNKKGAKPLSR